MPDLGGEMTWTAVDERPHGTRSESWWFDFSAADGGLAGFVRLVLHAERAWYWAALVGDGRPYLLVRDEDVPLPRPGLTEVRSEGLWSALECEEPFVHWTIGLEAFAVALDPPEEAWTGERGDLIGLGFDLEWETTDPPTRHADGYGQACAVHGDILVGPTERIDFTGSGWRSHTWGTVTEPVPPAEPGAMARHHAPLLVAGRRADYVLLAALTSGRGAAWRARDPGS